MHVCVRVCVCVCVCVYACTHLCMCFCISVCIHVCAPAHLCTCLYTCVWVCMYVRVCTHVHVNVWYILAVSDIPGGPSERVQLRKPAAEEREPGTEDQSKRASGWGTITGWAWPTRHYVSFLHQSESLTQPLTSPRTVPHLCGSGAESSCLPFCTAFGICFSWETCVGFPGEACFDRVVLSGVWIASESCDGISPILDRATFGWGGGGGGGGCHKCNVHAHSGSASFASNSKTAWVQGHSTAWPPPSGTVCRMRFTQQKIYWFIWAAAELVGLCLFVFYTMYTVCSLTDMISQAFVSLSFTPCTQCVPSLIWSVRPLSLCLLHHVHSVFPHWYDQSGLCLFVFYTMYTVCSLTDMISQAFVSLSYELQFSPSAVFTFNPSHTVFALTS